MTQSRKEAPIVVGLSGGVDSAVAAALLVEEGHEVIGITMRLYDAQGSTAATGRCCGPRDIADARKVCDVLDIPFYVVDFADDFQDAVVDDFVDTYLRGHTPNPCIRCNQSIKFTPLLRRARQLGAETLVTGHYARIENEGGRLALKRGIDRQKDQSYFLFSMPTDELASIRFPLGSYDKEETRKIAGRFALPNASKKDSQEICFVPDGDYAGFVERAAAQRGLSLPVAGDIVTEGGDVVGRHKGVHRYTIGQRRGIGDVKLPGGGPAYVVGLDVRSNRLLVGAAGKTPAPRFAIEGVRWFIEEPSASFETMVQLRHRATPVAASVEVRGETASVQLKGDAIVAPGQAAVFYDGDTVQGGGWIV
ncbi:MAG: tRNA 2-thiouridine(34) synthase MnmA [Myxococcales bacterium]|nr:tRNA 2-thiouridine(34) synthase MnmA [Myxococcales bacterium]